MFAAANLEIKFLVFYLQSEYNISQADVAQLARAADL